MQGCKYLDKKETTKRKPNNKKNQLKILFLTYFLNALCMWNVLGLL